MVRENLETILLGLALTAGIACGDEARDDEPPVVPTSATMTATSGEATDTTDSGPETTASESSGDEESGPSPFDDVAPPATGVDPDGEVGCSAVDFLFVIDNSGSMADEQANLIDSVPGFVTSIQERLPPGTGTFQVMVTDVDPWVYGGCPDACIEAAACEQTSPTGLCDCEYPCGVRDLCGAGGDYVCGITQPDTCEDVMGAGVTHPVGRDSSARDCDFASGKRFFTNAEPDVAAAFDCVARVGTNSSLGEKPMEAMVQALTGGGAVADCNEGFLRDDAILVVTIITDEDDNGPGAGDPEGDSEGTPQAWYEALVAAKGGNEQAIVALALIGDSDQPGGICAPLNQQTYEGAEPAPRIREFVDLFGSRGAVESVCAPSYEEFFMQTITTIGQACDEFTPEG